MTVLLQHPPCWIDGRWAAPLDRDPSPLPIYLANAKRLILENQGAVGDYMYSGWGFRPAVYSDAAVLLGRQRDINASVLFVTGSERTNKRTPAGRGISTCIEQRVTLVVTACTPPDKTRDLDYLQAAWVLSALHTLFKSVPPAELMRRPQRTEEADEDYGDYLRQLPAGADITPELGGLDVPELQPQRGYSLDLTIQFFAAWDRRLNEE